MMFLIWLISFFVIVYLVILFVVVGWVDKRKVLFFKGLIYGLLFGVYCIFWVFFGIIV